MLDDNLRLEGKPEFNVPTWFRMTFVKEKINDKTFILCCHAEEK